MSRKELSLFQKMYLAAASKLADLSIGYHVDFAEELVRQHGLAGMLKYGKISYQTGKELERGFGVEGFHLVAAFASFFNGCDYCSWGHLFALNLCFLERTGTLYPIDEMEVLELMQRGDSAVLEELGRRLADHPEHLRLIRRQHEIRNAAPGGALSDEDKLLLKSIALFEWINECSIVVNAPAPPMGEIARKTELLERYRQLRAPLRAEREAKKAATAAAQPQSAS